MSPLFDVNPDTGEILTQRESQCPHCAEEIQQRLIAEVNVANTQTKLQDAWREIARLKTELANQCWRCWPTMSRTTSAAPSTDSP
jgi:hypothetical protein